MLYYVQKNDLNKSVNLVLAKEVLLFMHTYFMFVYFFSKSCKLKVK